MGSRLQVRCGRTILTTNATTHHHCVNTTDGENIGLRAVLSTDHGRTFDFEHDRIIIKAQPATPAAGAPDPSGGGCKRPLLSCSAGLSLTFDC